MACLTQLSYYPQLAARVTELVTAGCTAEQIAEHLNHEGFRPPKRRETFGKQAVRDIMRTLGTAAGQHAIRRAAPVLGEHEWWLSDRARELGMSRVTLYSWVERGWVTAHRRSDLPRMWVIRADPAEIQRLRALHQMPRGQHNRRPWLSNQQANVNIEQEGDGRNVVEPRK